MASEASAFMGSPHTHDYGVTPMMLQFFPNLLPQLGPPVIRSGIPEQVMVTLRLIDRNQLRPYTTDVAFSSLLFIEAAASARGASILKLSKHNVCKDDQSHLSLVNSKSHFISLRTNKPKISKP
jgi:hypothetical protein